MIDITISNDLIINILIHVTILFAFLYFFFFLFISKKAEEVLNNNISNICDDNLPDILSDLDSKYGDKINWKELKEECQNIHDNPNQKINENIDQNNTYYKNLGIYISIGLFLITISYYIYVVYYQKETIAIKNILIENFFTFLLIGAIEYIFFVKTASNYIPCYPTSIGGIVLERIKQNIKNI
jgi:hypothetical protein